MIFFGIITVAAKNYITPQEFRNKVCETAQAKDVRAAYLGAVDKVMCSKICPCPFGEGN